MTAQMDHIQLRRRIIKACTACKQSKVRCDADGKIGKTCSRCRARGLECEVDAQFKRTPVRERMKAMAAELKQLRQTVREGETSPNRRSSHNPTGMEIVPNNEAFAHSDSDSFENSLAMAEQQLNIGNPKEGIAVEPTSFGPIVFSSEEIHECYRAYYDHFHRHLPILDQSTSIGALQKCSPVLFKTVLVIVCQRFGPLERNQHDFQVLVEVYQQMLNQSMLSSPLSLHTIQAILLICAWPLPTTFQLAEPSWLYCGVAMNAASYLNLGRSTLKPLYQGGQLSFADVENMSRTWLALFVITTNIATFIGAPLPFKHPSELAGIEARITRTESSHGLAVHAALAVLVSKHSGVISSDTDLATHTTLVALHVEELDGIYRKYKDLWNDELEFFLQAAKLHLRTFLWVRGPVVSEGPAETRRSAPPIEVLVAAAASASSVIEVYGRLVGYSPTSETATTSSDSSIAATMPKNYFRCLIHAAAFLLRFVCFNKTAPESDREMGRMHVNMAIASLKSTARVSLPRDDMPRAAVVMAKLLEHGDLLEEQRLQIDDRGGASIYWDTLHKSFQMRGIPTTRTDLMELIDPTRTIRPQREKDARRDSHMPTPSINSIFASDMSGNESAVTWDDSFTEFFDLNTFDFGDLGGSLAA